MDMDAKYNKIFCSCCGKWLGIKDDDANTKGVYVYCSRCRRNVKVTETEYKVNNNKKSAKVP